MRKGEERKNFPFRKQAAVLGGGGVGGESSGSVGWAEGGAARLERIERGRISLSLEGERVPTDGEFAEARNRRVLETQVREPGRAGSQTEVIKWERTVTELIIFLKSLNLANVMAVEGGVIPRSAQRISREGAPRSSSRSKRASRRTISRGWHNEDGRPRSSPAKVSSEASGKH